MLEVRPRGRSFVGTPSQVADEWVHHVRTRAVDGSTISPHVALPPRAAATG